MAASAAWQEWQRSKLLARWREANPGEATKVDSYWAGGARPELTTPVGRALVATVDAAFAWRPTPRAGDIVLGEGSHELGDVRLRTGQRVIGLGPERTRVRATLRVPPEATGCGVYGVRWEYPDAGTRDGCWQVSGANFRAEEVVLDMRAIPNKQGVQLIEGARGVILRMRIQNVGPDTAFPTPQHIHAVYAQECSRCFLDLDIDGVPGGYGILFYPYAQHNLAIARFRGCKANVNFGRDTTKYNTVLALTSRDVGDMGEVVRNAPGPGNEYVEL
jgi:hypothetical protein